MSSQENLNESNQVSEWDSQPQQSEGLASSQSGTDSYRSDFEAEKTLSQESLGFSQSPDWSQFRCSQDYDVGSSVSQTCVSPAISPSISGTLISSDWLSLAQLSQEVVVAELNWPLSQIEPSSQTPTYYTCSQSEPDEQDPNEPSDSHNF
jgi:hypothetical protein